VNGCSDDGVELAWFDVPSCVVGDGDGDVDPLGLESIGDVLRVVAVDGEGDA
jgi:hypothetical protein